MKLVTVAQMKAIEQSANKRGLSYAEMMRRAGKGLSRIIIQDFEAFGIEKPSPLAVALVGPGNNGGDALVALAELATSGWRVIAFLAAGRSEGDPLLQPFSSTQLLNSELDPGWVGLSAWLAEADVLIDGLLGTGARLPLKPEIQNLLAFISSRDSLPYVVAVDCPSGVDCDSGALPAETISADLTVSMQAVKTGLLTFPAFSKIGGLAVVDLDLPPGLAEWEEICLEVACDDRIAALLPPRPATAHKGTFGTVMVVAGSLNYTGAALLAGKAAYRSGAGLVRLAVPSPLHSVLAGQLPEATWTLLPHELGVIAENAASIVLQNLENVTALLVGPGFGLEETTAGFLRRLFEGQVSKSRRPGLGFLGVQAETSAAGVSKGPLPPVVVDADGLRLLTRLPEWPNLLPVGSILTPHPGEMAALTGLSVEVIQSNRLSTALQFAAAWNQVVILKGALTVIASPDGRAGVVPVATPGLARAGTGDVLAGIVAGLRAQNLPAYESALAGAYLHAQAGLLAVSTLGSSAAVLASDVLDALPGVLKELSE